MRRCAWLLALAGCFDKPPYRGGDGGAGSDGGGDGACVPSMPSAPGVVLPAGLGPLATMPGDLALGFASDATNYPLPDRLRINGGELLATQETCNFEDGLGVAVYPTYLISGRTSPTDDNRAFDRLVVGPAFTHVQANWDWQHPTACTGGTAVGRGQSHFSLFPDGRIVRNDSLVPSMQNTITPMGCQCSGASGVGSFIVTSYTTFETSQLFSLTLDSDASEASSLPPPDSIPPHTTEHELGACVLGTSNRRVAIAWDQLGMEPSVAPTRIRSARNVSTSHDITALVYDLDTNQPSLGALDAYGVRTTMLLSGSTSANCPLMIDAARAWATAAPITVRGTPDRDVAYGSFGVYVDTESHTGPVTIAAENGSIPGGFVVGVRFMSGTAVRTSRAGEPIVWQRESDGTFYIFFPQPLGTGQTITITPEC